MTQESQMKKRKGDDEQEAQTKNARARSRGQGGLGACQEWMGGVGERRYEI